VSVWCSGAEGDGSGRGVTFGVVVGLLVIFSVILERLAIIWKGQSLLVLR
jgi:hypothetical protein